VADQAAEIEKDLSIGGLSREAIRGTNLRTHAAVMNRIWSFPSHISTGVI
jgi:hypothetical protein